MILFPDPAMKLLDIHSHREYPEAITSCSPLGFAPKAGQYYSVGIHPWNVTADYRKDRDALLRIADDDAVLALGEAGLDKLVEVDMDLQTVVFKLQIELVEQVGKPLIIHSVRTSNELIRLKKQYNPKVPWILHGFRGNKNIADALVDEGFYLSFGEKYQLEALKAVPPERMFVETDESLVGITSLYGKLAGELSLTDNQFMAQIRQNIEEVFFNR